MIEPVIRAAAQRGLDVRGPVPADTAFTPQFLAGADVVVAMYHDQGLPVIKHVGFGNAVNVTLGLPILRTSVDHGTALDLARTGSADAGSLRAALALAHRSGARQPCRFVSASASISCTIPAVIRRIVDAVAPAPASAWWRSVRAAARYLRLLERAPAAGCRSRSTAISRGLLEADPRARRAPARARRERARHRLRRAARRAARRCASSATCPTTSRRRCCFVCSSSARRSRDMHFMLQKEVVDRMAAQPGGKDYGRLTVMLARLRRGRSACSTWGPAPSSRGPRSGPRSCACGPAARRASRSASDGALRTLVTAAFSHRRKTLRNGLKGLLTRRRTSKPAASIRSCGPETLTPAQFGLLAARYCRLRCDGALQSA